MKTVGVFAALLAAAAAQDGGYDENLALYFVDFAAASYCSGSIGHGVSDWSCKACKLHPGVEAIEFHENSHNINGYVAYDPATDYIMLVFAGPDPLSYKNYWDEMVILQQKYDSCPGCKVHTGFYKSFVGAEDKVLYAWDILRKSHPEAKTAVVGHSFGAALAVHGAIALKEKREEHLDLLYNFGQPRVGNQKFASWYNETITDGKQFRITHHKDPVPQMPPAAFGFHHESTEVYYDKFNDDYKVCDGTGEDPECSNQWLLNGNWRDHLTYLGEDFVAQYMTCKLFTVDEDDVRAAE